MFPDAEDFVSPSVESGSGTSHSSSLLFNLSILKDKLSEVQTLVGVILSPNQSLPESTSMAISSMNSTIQEIVVTATSMMFTCQQMALTAPPGTNNNTNKLHHHQNKSLPHSSNINFATNGSCVLGNNIGTDNISDHHGLFSSTESETLDWFSESYNNNDDNSNSNIISKVAISENNIITRGGGGGGVLSPRDEPNEEGLSPKMNSDDIIIELDAANLLAKYTHYCQVCGKGFKRDANLRMHMRAHGDEYKTNAALSNPIKNKGNLLEGGRECLMSTVKPKYSCPQEGCRWNQRHVKFQPLKSMICAKNHYKRSHCPKMYVCKRCNQKQFSVLSDLRTHEKHCGDLKWQCTCGTSFSRKDKLMGHVALFVGHQPAAAINNSNALSFSAKLEQQHTLQM